MNLDRFGLAHDPFAGLPDEAALVAVPSRADTLDRLVRCLDEGKGLAVLTAASGLGKTALCREVVRRLSDRHRVCHLRDASYTTRRGLLQSMLHELGRPYNGLTEHEARLTLLDALRVLSTEGRGLVLIIDEGHRLNDRLLEELRALSNHEQAGTPLVRVLICGDLSLEERLIDPALGAVAQRVLCHEVLPPLTQEESARLLDGRIMQVGGDGWEHVFTRPAMELLCLVSDGSPRNLEQLAARSLRLGAARREPLVSVDAVRAALSQLKELPLQWNEPANLDAYAGREDAAFDAFDEAPRPRAVVSECAETWSAESPGEPGTSVPGFEGSEDLETLTAEPRQEDEMREESHQAAALPPATPSLPLGEGCGVIEFGAGIPSTPTAEPIVSQTRTPAPNHWSEIEIDDRYASLDRQFETGVPADLPAPRTHLPAPILSTPNAATLPSHSDDIEQRLLHEVESLSAAIRSAEPPRSNDESPAESPTRSDPPALATSPWCTGWSEMPEWDVVQPEWVVETPTAGSSELPTAPAASETHEAAWETHPAPLAPSPPHVEPSESHPALATLSFEAHQPSPSLNAAVETPPLVAGPDHSERQSAAREIADEDTQAARSPEPVASVRIDQPSARPYSRLFSRLRRLRAG